MRTCIITNETFEPKNPDHFFSSVDAFNTFVKQLDPMDSFNPEKREIQWSPQERIDPKTGKKFLAMHPAQIYAPDTEEEKEEANSTATPTKVHVKECAKCHREFLRTSHGMKYCEECSERGGELVKQ